MEGLKPTTVGRIALYRPFKIMWKGRLSDSQFKVVKRGRVKSVVISRGGYSYSWNNSRLIYA